MAVINIAKDYSKTPGGRFKREGKFSGEDFRERILKKIYLQCKEKNEQLIVNLDGGYGYGSSFLEEAFGGLVRCLKNVDLDLFTIISDEEPQLVDDVKCYMQDAKRLTGGK